MISSTSGPPWSGRVGLRSRVNSVGMSVRSVVSDEERESFHCSLPTNRMAAGCVLRNVAGEILVVKPTYKDYWELPGGAVEHDESL